MVPAAPATDQRAQDTAVASPASGRARWFARLTPPLLYLAVTLVFLLPLPFHLGRAAISDRSPDIWIHLWWMWQVRESVLQGQNPYETMRVFHPTGAPLYLMGQDMVTAILSIPFQGLVGLVATYNLLTVAAVAFAAWAMYLLALDVTGSRAGALVAGAIFGFAPLQGAFLNLGQMEWVNVGFLPLAVLFLLRLRRDRRLATALLGGVFVALTAYSSWYQVLFLGLFAALYAGWELLAQARRRHWATARRFVLRLALWGFAALVLVSPALVPTMRLAARTGFAVTPLYNVTYSSIDVLDPFRPNRLNPLFGAGRRSLTASLGYVAIALSLLGLWRLRRRGAFWALTIVAFYLLALGPYLKAGGREWYLPILPYNLLYALPFGNIARVPTRFLVVVTLAQAVLAAWAVGWLAATKRGARTGDPLAGGERGTRSGANGSSTPASSPRPVPRSALRAPSFVALALALVLAEAFPAPRALADTAVEPVYAALAGGPPGAVYELPYDDRALAMYRATVHRRPLIGGYVSRPVPYPLLDGVPVIADLRNRSDAMLEDLTGPDIVEQPPHAERAVAILDAYDVRYVILRRDAGIAADQLAYLAAVLERLLPRDTIVFDEGPLRVYRIPEGAHSGVVAGFGSGWHPLEWRTDTGQRFRWTNGDATMPLTLLDKGARTVTMTAMIFSYARPTTVDIYLGDTLLTTVAAEPAPRQIAVTLPLAHGYNGLRLRAREAPLRPSELGGAGQRDNRPLSFALSDVRITGP